MERPASNFLSPRWPDPNLFFSRLLICLLPRLNVPQTSLAFPPWDFYCEFPFPYTKSNNVQIYPISTPININPIPALSIRPNTHTAFCPAKKRKKMYERLSFAWEAKRGTFHIYFTTLSSFFCKSRSFDILIFL